MNWKGCGRNWCLPLLRYCDSVWMEVLRRTTKNLIQDRRFPDRDLNSGHSLDCVVQFLRMSQFRYRYAGVPVLVAGT
jgi:hypothetical protein